MKKYLITLLAMSMTASGLWAQIDVHSHAITESYMDFIRTHGAEMDEGFPIPSWKVEEHLAFMDKADPCKIYILEVYADREAYQAHLQTAHFRKYKEGTADMVKSLKLIDTNPLVTAEFLKKAQ